MFGRERIEWKSPEQVRLMRTAGLVVADSLDAVRDAVRPGVTTAELDAVAADVIAAAGALPAFLGYQGYPATLCVSVNDEVVHGIPGSRVVRPGDVVSVDCGAVVQGWFGDAAFSVVVDGGPDADADRELVRVTEQAMWAGVSALHGAARLGEVGEAVEDVVGDRYAIVEGYVGHGIGTAMHQAPDVLNHRARGRSPRVRPGLCVAVEPMLVRPDAAGDTSSAAADTTVLDDDWTVVTASGARAAHWEHTVAVLPEGLWVLTARDGGESALGALGVPVSPLA